MLVSTDPTTSVIMSSVKVNPDLHLRIVLPSRLSPIHECIDVGGEAPLVTSNRCREPEPLATFPGGRLGEAHYGLESAAAR